MYTSLKGIISPIENIAVKENSTFREAITIINNTRSGVAVIVSRRGKLTGILTDGDIRRAILKGVSLESPVSEAMVVDPVTVSPDYTKGEIFRIFTEKMLSHLPVVDADSNVIGIVYESSLRAEGIINVPVVIMAGGYGKRLRPITETVPKPMLKLGDKPILEVIIERFRELGASEFYITVNYLADIIMDYFGDGRRHRININYVRESAPLGTAGSLRLLPSRPEKEFFVTNADILADIDYRVMHNHHVEREAAMTVAIKRQDIKVPYGVIEVSHERVVSISEKPVIQNNINAGIYILSSSVIDAIPEDIYFDMPELIGTLLRDNKLVSSYLINGTWIDIGQPNDYSRAQDFFGNASEGCGA